MEDNVISEARKCQGEDFSKTMCCTGDKGKWGHGLIINAPSPRFDFAAAPLSTTKLLSEKIRDEEPDISRAFGETAHKVWIPLRAKGNIDTDGIALFNKLFL